VPGEADTVGAVKVEPKAYMCPLFEPVPNKTNELTIKAIKTMLKRDLSIPSASSKSYFRYPFCSFACLGYSTLCTFKTYCFHPLPTKFSSNKKHEKMGKKN
jgi:hypothetical protein